MSHRPKRRAFVRYAQPGTAPGTLRAPEELRIDKVRVTVIDYDAEHLQEKEVHKLSECIAYRDTPSVTWINVDGLHDVALLEALGTHYGLHPLALEDVLNVGQRPKVEDYDRYQFTVLKSLRLEGEELQVEQISLFFGTNYVLTFQEIPGDSFEAVRERIRKGKGRIRKTGADYLAYALTDALIDEFFPVLEVYGERIETLEEELVSRPTTTTLHQIHRVKRDLLTLRRIAWPQRDLLNALLRSDSELITAETKIFLRDCYDHITQVMDIVETYRELAAGMLDVYLSSLSNRMNEIMKVLTIISTIFIPLSFIAGVYGMNFNTASPYNMPELNWRYGYPFSLGVMLAVAVGLLYYFRRRKWF